MVDEFKPVTDFEVAADLDKFNSATAWADNSGVTVSLSAMSIPVGTEESVQTFYLRNESDTHSLTIPSISAVGIATVTHVQDIEATGTELYTLPPRTSLAVTVSLAVSTDVLTGGVYLDTLGATGRSFVEFVRAAAT